MLYGLYVITLVIGFLATIARRSLSCELDTSVGVSGQHDFSVRHDGFVTPVIASPHPTARS